jgi:hypothetical protein
MLKKDYEYAYVSNKPTGKIKGRAPLDIEVLSSIFKST